MKYAYGTSLTPKPGPFSCGWIRAKAVCADGVVRSIAWDARRETSGVADTFFSVPARVRIRGKWVSGYVTSQTVSGLSTPCEADPGIVVFVHHTKGKNAALLPPRPDLGDFRKLLEGKTP